MAIKTRLASLSGASLLVLAGLAVCWGIYMLAEMVLWGVTSARFLTMLLSIGFGLVFASTGIFLRKVASRTVLPLAVDRDNWVSSALRYR